MNIYKFYKEVQESNQAYSGMCSRTSILPMCWQYGAEMRMRVGGGGHTVVCIQFPFFVLGVKKEHKLIQEEVGGREIYSR